MIGDAERAAIAAREAAATPGPWQTEPNTYAGRVWVQRSPVKHRWHGKDCEPLFSIRDRESYEQREKDAAFIAHAREDIPRLLKELEAAEAERDALREVVELAAKINCTRAAWHTDPHCGQCTSCRARALVQPVSDQETTT